MHRMRERQFAARVTLLHYALILLLALFACSAVAQDESDPVYKFNQPSDEMDFTIQPVPEIPGNLPPPPPGENAEGVPPADSGLYGFGSELPPAPSADEAAPPQDGTIDQFFSTTTIVAPDKQPEPAIEATEQETVAEEPKKVQKRKIIKPASPPFNFKSVRLPEAIYHRPNTHINKHLPFAYYMEDQQYLLMESIKKDDLAAVRALYKNGADIVSPFEDGTPLLTLAVQHHSVNVARWLLMYRADPNQMDEKGLAPIHYAAYAGNHQIVELLLTYGADKHLQDAKGRTALMYAEHGYQPTIVPKMLAY